VASVDDRELVDALVSTATLSLAAAVLRVDVKELVVHLDRPAVAAMLRAARIAAAAQAEMRVVAAMAMAAEDLQHGGTTDFARVVASKAVLEYGARVVKADRTAAPTGKSGWGEAPPPFTPAVDEPRPPGAAALEDLPTEGTA
jgi:hypothetical protein